jgi:multimeric flavodoxin WrbA
MHILGIVGSRRRLGNTEILVKEALKGARDEGASVEIIRLSDLYIQECNGCMACMLKNAPCRLKDDRNWLYDRLDEAQGLVVGAPSYHGWAPGIFSTIQFRTTGYRQFHVFAPDKGKTKKAVTLAAAGGVAIAGNVIPALNVLVHRMGFEPLASFIAGSQGPGEVLLPERETIIREVNRLGRDLVFDWKGETDRLSEGVHKLRCWDWASHGYAEEKLSTVEDCCPFCFGQGVVNYSWFHTNPLPPGEVECAFCHYSRGRVEVVGGKARFNLKKKPDEDIIRDWEWRKTVWHRESGVLYQERRAEFLERRAAYGQFEPEWSVPEGREANRPSAIFSP